jgi:hypothetical protein
MTGDYAQNPTININDPMNEALATIPAINPNLDQTMKAALLKFAKRRTSPKGWLLLPQTMIIILIQLMPFL